MRTVPSNDEVSTRWSVRENDAVDTAFVCPVNVRKHLPTVTSQRRAVQSIDAVNIEHPSGENDTDITTSECPTSVWRRVPERTSNMQELESLDAVATNTPSGENTAVLTSSVWPVNTCKQSPVSEHHNRTLQSSVAPTKYKPSGEKEHECILSRSVVKCTPVSAHHKLPLPFAETITRVEDPGAMAEAHTREPTSTRICTPLWRCLIRAVPSIDDVRHRNGVSTAVTSGLSTEARPASCTVKLKSSMLELSISCTTTPTSWDWRRTASHISAMVLDGRTRTFASCEPLSACRTIKRTGASSHRNGLECSIGERSAMLSTSNNFGRAFTAKSPACTKKLGCGLDEGLRCRSSSASIDRSHLTTLSCAAHAWRAWYKISSRATSGGSSTSGKPNRKVPSGTCCDADGSTCSAGSWSLLWRPAGSRSPRYTRAATSECLR
mmetsp:Transcript_1817/g.5382  ORF Transcript_1817/g.5382 Transcript_1817/m.5382 type:complete len:437 (+) Transcript_1817:446-1756(+)